MRKEYIKRVNFNDFSCLIFTGTCLASEPSREATLLSLEKAKAANIPIILDIDYRPYTWTSSQEASTVYLRASSLCDIVIGNDEEFGILAMKFEDSFKQAKKLSKDISLIIYKKGERGSVTLYNNKEVTKGIFPVKALKPTGAGDAFMGAFIGSLLKVKSVEESIEIASAAAALVVTKVGCAPAMPMQKEIEEFMKIHKITK